MSVTDPTSSPAHLAPGTWHIDPFHSSVNFRIPHLFFGRVRGRFDEFGGTVEIGDRPQEWRVEAHAIVASLNSGFRARDQRLLGPEILDVASYPQIGFSGEGLEPHGDEWRLPGTLSLHGSDQPVVFSLSWRGAEPDQQSPDERNANFFVHTTISRSAFGITAGPPMPTGASPIGEEIELELEISLLTYDPQPLLDQFRSGEHTNPSEH